jgi:hypothetical protein
LQPSDSPLIGFRGKKIDALGKISLPVSFGVQENARTEYVTFDVVDLYYPYNAIFGRGFANMFSAAIHMGYLCMKMPALHGTIAVTPQVLDLHLTLALHEPKHYLFIYEHGTHMMH